jgi:hypothetical protein
VTITINGIAQSTGNSIAGTTLVINKPTSLANGDVMVQTMDIGSIVDTVTAPAGWLPIPGPTWPVSTAAFRQYAFYKVVLDASSETSTYTFTISASVKNGGGIQAYSGVDIAAPWDVNAASFTASATPLAITAITTVTPGALLVSGAAVDADTAATLTAPGSMTQEYQTAGKRTAQADEAFPTPGTTGTRTWTASVGALTMAGWLGALRPAVLAANLYRSTSVVIAGKLRRLRQIARGQRLNTVSTGAGVDVDGSITATAALAGDAAVTHPVDGTITVTAAIAGDISAVSTTKTIDGAITGTATITGTVAVTHPVAGDATATAAVAGTATVTHPVAGSITATATHAATATVTHPLSGSVSASATHAATATVTHPVDGALSATAGRTGVLAVTHPVDGAITGTAAIAGTLDVVTAGHADVDGTRTATAAITGALAVTHTLDGVLLATAARVGALNLVSVLAGQLQVQADITGSLDIAAAYTPMLSYMDTDLDGLTVLHGGASTGSSGLGGRADSSGHDEGGSTGSSGYEGMAGASGAVS